jgi:hypothetical protein
MATKAIPQPPSNALWSDPDGRPSRAFTQYMLKLDLALHGLVAMISAQSTSTVPLISVATPTNANAAAADVAVEQFYYDTANPPGYKFRTA